jgi:hypothetical protein
MLIYSYCTIYQQDTECRICIDNTLYKGYNKSLPSLRLYFALQIIFVG